MFPAFAEAALTSISDPWLLLAERMLCTISSNLGESMSATVSAPSAALPLETPPTFTPRSRRSLARDKPAASAGSSPVDVRAPGLLQPESTESAPMGPISPSVRYDAGHAGLYRRSSNTWSSTTIPLGKERTPAATTRSANMLSSVTADPRRSGSPSIAAMPAGVERTGSPAPIRVSESEDDPESPTTFVVNL
ncbi:unannotated protein [freshwater metagenome]|uniref:Unannotated protein n=1 Tax=freshwater metagenome TaxID=449393 RepID=A0A6J7DIE8_9ZZZZ